MEPKKEKLLYLFKPSTLIIGLHLKFPIWFFLGPFLILSFAKGLQEGLTAGGLSVLIFGFPFIKHGLDLAFTKCFLYKDHLESTHGWIQIHRRVINFNKVVDVAYTQNVLERILNIGEIMITTTSVHHVKLIIPAVGKPATVFREIRKIVAQYTEQGKASSPAS